MRDSIYKITNDDEPLCMGYPLACSGRDFQDANGNDPALVSEVLGLRVGSSVTVGGRVAIYPGAVRSHLTRATATW